MSEINVLIDQIIVDSLKHAKKIDMGTGDSKIILEDLQSLMNFKSSIEKLELSNKELEQKIKNEERNLKLKTDEFNQKVKNDEDNLKMRSKELDQRIKSEEANLKFKTDELNKRIKTEEDKLRLQREELEQRIKTEEENLKIKNEEFNQKIKSEEERIKLQREELEQKIKNDQNRNKLERLKTIQDKLDRMYLSETQSKNELIRNILEVVKILVVCGGTVSIANGVFAVEEAGVVRSKAFPLMGNLLGRIR